jgi:hypothetical protein
MKLLRLRHTVLADGGIQDEQDLMWSAFMLAGDHPSESALNTPLVE